MRRINVGAFWWSIWLSLSSIGICYLFISERLAMFLHPRGQIVLALAWLLLVLLVVVSWRQVRSFSSHMRVIWGHVLLMLSLLLVLVLICPPQPLPTDRLGQKGILGVLRRHVNELTEGSPPVPALAQERVIVVDNENFVRVMDAFWTNTDVYVGCEVEMLGFVYIDPALASSDFVLARLIMTCCAADAQMAGLLCRYPECQNLVSGQWVRVRGMLGKLSYYDVGEKTVVAMPYLQVNQLQVVDKPAQEYIYP